MTADVWRRCREGYGPHSAREPNGSGFSDYTPSYPRNPPNVDSMEEVTRWFHAYDTGVRYVDDHVGRLLNALADLGVLDETAVVVSADHGECLGELNVWGDHQTADHITARVPLIVRWPGLTDGGRVDRALHYQFDWAATTIELMGGNVPENWDGFSFAGALRDGREEGRSHLVLSMGAWACMRSVRWEDLLCMWTYHDGYKWLEPVMLFDVSADPHEQRDLAAERADKVAESAALLAGWQRDMMQTSGTNVDPLMTVMREGGPWQVRGQLRSYAERLRDTGRAWAAERLLAEHSEDLTWRPD
jgi:arylsulfatase A-like enzyme